MGFLFFLIIVFVIYVVIRYKETTFPLLKKVFGDIQSDIDKLKSENKGGSSNMPYVQRGSFFNASELEFFRILNSSIDAHRFTIFPKVRLADVVEVDSEESKKNFGAWNRIKSKHVDYLIWDLVESKVVMAVELDGGSHNSKSSKDKDEFKNNLFDTVGLQLTRVRVGTDFEAEARKIAEQLGH